MSFEILSDNPENQMLNAAFDLIKKKIDEGHRFSNDQKDLGILMSIDSLAPAERPWFFEVSQMLKIPLWQTLWGQWRRCQETGIAQAPILDPGWEGELTGDYGLEERVCGVCNEVFKPGCHGQLFCSNRCGAEDERRKKGIMFPASETGRWDPDGALPAGVLSNLTQFPHGAVSLLPIQPGDDSDSLDLGTDIVETN